MNLEVYTFSCLLKDYDEDYAALSFQDQYDLAPKHYKQFLSSRQYKELGDFIDAIHTYLEEKYIMDDSIDIDYSDYDNE
jgi:hypothetical protein